MVVVGALVRAVKLPQVVGLRSTLVLLDYGKVSTDLGDNTGGLSDEHVSRVDRGEGLHTGSHNGGLGTNQGHCLTLHVRTHERAVCIVVLKERNQGGGNRDHLTRRHVDVVDEIGGDQLHLSTLLTNKDLVLSEGAISVQRGTRLGDNELVLVACGQVVNVL